MNLYNIVETIIGYTQQSQYQNNSTIVNICGVLIILFVVWFMDCLYRLFFRH